MKVKVRGIMEQHIERPCRAPTLKFLGRNSLDRMVFFLPEGPSWISLPPQAAALLSLCDGARDVTELSEVFGFSGPKEEKDALIVRLIRSFDDLGFLKGPRMPEEPHLELAPLEMAVLYVTRWCNLACNYCYFDAGRAMEGELSTDQWLNVVDQLHEMGTERIVLLGGEPLGRDDIFAIGSRGLKHGMCVDLATNGTLVTQRMAEEAAASFTLVQVSLDGFREQHEAGTRIPGSFDRTVEGIRTLVRHGNQVGAAFVATEENIHGLDDYLRFIVDLGVRRVHFPFMKRIGRAKCNPIHELSGMELVCKLRDIWHTWHDSITMADYSAFFKPGWRQRRLRCSAGNGMVEIAPNGDVYSCCMFFGDETPAGNVASKPISEIYTGMQDYQELLDSSALNRIPCKDCDFKLLCGGGCPGEEAADTVASCKHFDLYHRLVLEAGHEQIESIPE